MRKETLFSFRDDYPGDVSDFMDRQKWNRVLRDYNLPINIYGLDVLCTLTTFPPAQRTFSSILEDMVTLTPPEGKLRRRTEDPITPTYAQKILELVLANLERHDLIRVRSHLETGATICSITKLGKEIMRQAKEAFQETGLLGREDFRIK